MKNQIKLINRKIKELEKREKLYNELIIKLENIKVKHNCINRVGKHNEEMFEGVHNVIKDRESPCFFSKINGENIYDAEIIGDILENKSPLGYYGIFDGFSNIGYLFSGMKTEFSFLLNKEKKECDKISVTFASSQHYYKDYDSMINGLKEDLIEGVKKMSLALKYLKKVVEVDKTSFNKVKTGDTAVLIETKSFEVCGVYKVDIEGIGFHKLDLNDEGELRTVNDKYTLCLSLKDRIMYNGETCFFRDSINIDRVQVEKENYRNLLLKYE